MIEKQIKNVMLDIETLGNQSYSVITSLGAVEFDIETGETGREFWQNIDVQSCLDVDLKVNSSTIKWWFNQTKEAQDQMFKNAKPLKTVLSNFSNWIDRDSIVWGNSCRFDCGILQNAYDKVGIKLPWKYQNERCVRTLLMFEPDIKDTIEFEGTAHNALHDCYFQIKYCTQIYNKLKF